MMREDVRASGIFDITAYGEAQDRKEQEPPVTTEDAEKVSAAPPAPVAENMDGTQDDGTAEKPQDQEVTDLVFGEAFPDLVLGDEARTKFKESTRTHF